MSDPIYWMLVDSHQAPLEASRDSLPLRAPKYSAFRFPKRRNEWLLGRWTAKTLAHSLPAYQQYSLDQIEIRNTPKAPPISTAWQGRSGGMPDHQPQRTLGLVCAGARFGTAGWCDLEKVEARTETFILDYFTPAEQQLVDKASSRNPGDARHPDLERQGIHAESAGRWSAPGYAARWKCRRWMASRPTAQVKANGKKSRLVNSQPADGPGQPGGSAGILSYSLWRDVPPPRQKSDRPGWWRRQVEG